MSSILLLLEDGEMHPFVPGSGAGQIILTRGDGSDSNDGDLTYTDAVITSVDGDTETLTLGNHFLTTEMISGLKNEEGTVITKLEVDNIPMEVVVEKTPTGRPKKRKNKNADYSQNNQFNDLNNVNLVGSNNEKKVCLWPTGNGTSCGKTFTKFDSLKRHLSEAHQGLRPFACTLCEKTYGRRDYLQRHLKSHNNTYAVHLTGNTGNISGTTATSSSGPAQFVKKVNTSVNSSISSEGNQMQNNNPNSVSQLILQVQQPTQQSISGGTAQLIQSPQTTTMAQSANESSPISPNPNPVLNTPSTLPFFSLSGQLPTAEPMGSKICRWVQNDGTVCGKAFSKLDSLRRHVNELHKGVRPYACNLCDKSYGRRDYLDRHLRTHEKKAARAAAAAADGSIDWGPNSGVLLAGDEVPPAPKVPKKKRKDIPPEEKKICLWILDDGTACGKTFTKFDSLKRHVSEAHKQIRPYSCSLCGKNYGRRDYLLRHLKSHNEVETSNIKIEKIQNNPSNHPANNMHSFGNLNTSASSTGSSTSSTTSTNALPSINFHQMVPQPPQALQGILTSPTNPTPKMSSSSSVTSKKRAMEDKKTCKWVLDNGTVCGKSFSKFDSLRRHVAELHKNIRPFMCSLCPKSYGRKDYLDRHMRSHADEENNSTNMTNMAEGGVDSNSASDILDHHDHDDEQHLDEHHDEHHHDEHHNEHHDPGSSSTPTIITSTSSIIDADDIETTTTTVVVDTGDPSEEVILPNVVTVVSTDDM